MIEVVWYPGIETNSMTNAVYSRQGRQINSLSRVINGGSNDSGIIVHSKVIQPTCLTKQKQICNVWEFIIHSSSEIRARE